MIKQVTVEVPEEALKLLAEDASRFGRDLLEAAVLRWFEEGRLSQGQAASMLGLRRGEFFDLLYAHQVSPVQMSLADLVEDFRRG